MVFITKCVECFKCTWGPKSPWLTCFIVLMLLICSGHPPPPAHIMPHCSAPSLYAHLLLLRGQDFLPTLLQAKLPSPPFGDLRTLCPFYHVVQSMGGGVLKFVVVQCRPLPVIEEIKPAIILSDSFPLLSLHFPIYKTTLHSNFTSLH